MGRIDYGTMSLYSHRLLANLHGKKQIRIYGSAQTPNEKSAKSYKLQCS